jgi:hypothetical protein
LPRFFEESAVLSDEGTDVFAIQSEGVDEFVQESRDGATVAFDCENAARAF